MKIPTSVFVIVLAIILLPTVLSANTLYFPQVPYGGGYTTTIVIMNKGTSSISGRLDLYDQSGNLKFSETLNISAGGSQRYALSGSAVLNDVYGIFNAGIGYAEGVATFDLRDDNNVLIATAGILGVSAGNSFILPVDQTATGSTGVAIANTQFGTSVAVNLKLLNEDGTLFASAADVRLNPLGPRHQIADFVTSMFPQLAGTTFKGMMVVQAASGASPNSLAVAALTVKEGMLSAIGVIPYTVGAGAGGLTDVGAYGVLRTITSDGNTAPNNGCAVSDGNQGWRIDRSFAVDPSNPLHLYVGVEFMGFFVSNDGGLTWIRSSSGLIGYPRADDPAKPCISEIAQLVLDPQDPAHLLLCKAGEPGTIADIISENHGIYESKDGGGSWRQILTQPGLGVYVHDGMAFAPDDSKTIYAGTTTDPRSVDGSYRVYPTIGIVYRTQNGGATWDELPTGTKDNVGTLEVNVSRDAPGTITVFSLGRVKHPGADSTFDAGLGVLRSTDAGATWKVLNNTAFNRVNVADKAPSHVVGIGSGDYLYSTDGGATFGKSTNVFHASNGPPGNPFIARLNPNDPLGMAGMKGDDDGAIWLTANGGATYTWAGQLPLSGTFKTVISQFDWGSDGALYAAGHYKGSVNGVFVQEAFIFCSRDKGVTWTRILNSSTLPK